MPGYSGSIDHLLDELRRMDLLVRLHVARYRATPGSPDDFKGLCIKEQDIDNILEKEDPFGPPVANELSIVSPLSDRLAVLESEIIERRTAALQEGKVLRLQRLQQLFHLSDFDVHVLLLCLMPELRRQYEWLYAYVQDDITKKRPTVDMVLDVLDSSFQSRIVARHHFGPLAPLVWHRLVEVFAEGGDAGAPPLLAHFLKIDERIVQYLLGSDETDGRLISFIQRVGDGHRVDWSDVVLPEDTKKHLMDLLECYARGRGQLNGSWSDGLIVWLQGATGVGKQTAARALCREFGLSLLVVDLSRLLRDPVRPEITIRLIFREALLQQTALYFDHFEVLAGNDDKIRARQEPFFEELERLSGLTFLASSSSLEPPPGLRRKAVIRVDVPPPGYGLRKNLWQKLLEQRDPSNIDVPALASRFRLSAGRIQDAVSTASNLALWRDPQAAQLTSKDLYNACRIHSSQTLSTLAQKVRSPHTWNDLVLPKEQLSQLREIVNYVKHRHRVYVEWAFDEKLSAGKGLNALFAGPSGTGKTMAAGVIAAELGLDVFKIDLSSVVSKYIGETEKNLSRIFQEAHESNAILFFDEADALFGKRSEVKDAHDRYANIEISYLLQRMEDYEGIAILATNLRKNIDESFVRRMHAAVEFPFPEEDQRRRIWGKIFPKQAELHTGIDYDFMARQFKLAGGNIKNVAVHAAFLAAEDSQAIDMRHLIQATKREFQKMGKLCSPAEFMEYFEFVRSTGD